MGIRRASQIESLQRSTSLLIRYSPVGRKLLALCSPEFQLLSKLVSLFVCIRIFCLQESYSNFRSAASLKGPIPDHHDADFPGLPF